MNYILADTEVQYDKFSQKDKMITVYVPFDCKNKCRFCTSKSIYKNKVDANKVKEILNKVRLSDIKEVVFTGGEPLENLFELQEMIKRVDNKNIYINTSAPALNFNNFVNFVNGNPHIKGVNISRHYKSYSKDAQNSCFELATDQEISRLKCNVRINVVLTNENRNELESYVARWAKIKKPNLDINFRENYNLITPINLHSLDNDVISYLSHRYEYFGQIYCHACDKLLFTSKDFLGLIRYHRGLNLTRIQIGNSVVEMQELVLFPDGELCTDWDKTKTGLEKYCQLLNLKY